MYCCQKQLAVLINTRRKTKFNLYAFFNRELLGHLTEEQFERLEKALCSAEGLGTLERKKKESKQKKSASKKVEASTGPPASQVSASGNTPLDLPSSHDPECVFEPRPHGAEGITQKVLI